MHLKIVGSGGGSAVVMDDLRVLLWREVRPLAEDSEEEEKEQGQNAPPQVEDSWEAGGRGGSPAHQASFFP